MLLERYYDDSLAQATYLIACERTREAIVIDPNVIEDCAATINAKRLNVRYVTETHIHADYLSGSRELAKRHKATLLLPGEGGEGWMYADAGRPGVQSLRDGDVISVGKVRLDVMHVPGHTPEHVCFVVTDTATGDKPIGIVSGDFLFVGDVGRPDLLEKAANVKGSMETAARQLYRSLQRLKRFPDYVQVWPGHGAGSACGKSLSPMPQSTLGYERLFNPALQHATEDAFVAWVLADQPEPPPYFTVMKRWNRDGAPESTVTGIRWVTAELVEDALEKGVVQFVDLRTPREFAKEHIAGTINIPETRSFVTYAGTVLDYERPVVTLVNGREQSRRMMQLCGLIGILPGPAKSEVIAEIKQRGKRPMASLRTVEAPALAKRLESNGVRVIDVRGRSEWNGGHLPNAEHIYLGDLAARAHTLRRDEPIVVHCQTGTRSSIAASMLLARGFTDVTDFPGGFAAWRKAGLPVETE